MTTTAVFAEIIAIGIQAVIVLGVGLAAVVDLGPVASELQNWAALTTVAVLAIAYVLGVAVDRLADSLLGALITRRGGPSQLDFGRARLRVLQTSSPLANFLEYQRSRMRLMRGTVLNLLTAIPIVNLTLARMPSGVSVGVYLLANGLLVGTIAACWYAHMQIRKAQDRWLDLLVDEASSLKPQDTSQA